MRSQPTDAQRAELDRLYERVPRVTTVRHEWQTDPGRQFMAYVRELAVEEDIPLTWIADHLGLRQSALQQVMTRPTERRSTRPIT